MLELRSLLRWHSNPSTLTAAGLSPNFILAHPPLRAGEDGDDGVGNGEKVLNISSLNLASWVNGLAALLGGDPQKIGGGEPTRAASCSSPQSFIRIISRSSCPACESHTSTWWLICHLKCLIGWLVKSPTRRGFGQTTVSFRSEMKTDLLISSQAVTTLFWRSQWFILMLWLYRRTPTQTNRTRTSD